MNSDYTHLHLHTHYSLLDGAIRIGDLVEKAKEYKMEAVAMTDHGNMYGAVDFYKKVKGAGLKPIIGMEAYVANGSHLEREKGTRHLILLAKNATGYQNLMRLSSEAHLNGFYYHPRIDRDLLRKHSEGLVGLTACLGGVISQELMRGSMDSACALAKEYSEIFEEGHFFLEIQPNGMAKQIEVNEKMIQVARATRLPLIATGDCHYMRQEEARAHDVLMCIQTGKAVSDPNRMRHETDQLYFKSQEEMIRAFADLPEAIENTRRVAEMIDLELKFEENFLPQYPLPPGEEYASFLSRQAMAGLEARFKALPYKADRDRYTTRLREELEIIGRLGFAGYFLIVWDFIKYAKEQGIPVGPGRGSGAGSLAAWSLGITDIDPIPFNLLFQRFLNPERVSMPDFDIDFCQNRRGEVVSYVTEKYGKDRVAQIATFHSLKARAVIHDVGRALGMTPGEVEIISKLIPDTLGMTLEKALEIEPKINELRKSDSRIHELIDVSLTLEGLNRHAGTHAAGVVIAQKPVWEHVPVWKGKNGELITQYAKDETEAAGLVKFDFLGLKTLTVIHEAVRLVNATRAADRPPVDINTIPLDDAEVYALIGSGDTDGVFQLESSGFKELVKKLKPDCFEDIIALVALYRPGPLESGMVDSFIKRKHGEEAIDYQHPLLEEILKETYGVIVYQEQVMRISQVLAGYTLGAADILRRAMGKKKPEEMRKQKDIFLLGATKNNVDTALAERIFDLMAKFAGYGFNKSHSAAYALVSYQTAWIKCHHPVEFMAALLTSEKDNTDKLVRYMHTAQERGIRVLPPDINISGMDFTVHEGAVRFGLSAIKNVGGGAVDEILKTRDEQPFTSLLHFCKQVDLAKVNRRVVESLIQCGAFDSIHSNRAALIAVLDEAMDLAATHQRDRAAGQSNLFDMMGGGGASTAETPGTQRMPVMPDWPERDRLRHEKALLGLFVSAHPLDRVKEEMEARSNARCEMLSEIADDAKVFLAGLLDQPNVRMTKAGKKMAYVWLEDLTGRAELVVFPKTYEAVADLLESEDPVQVVARVKREEENVRLHAQAIIRLADAPTLAKKDQEVKRAVVVNKPVTPADLHFQIAATRLSDPSVLAHFKQFLSANPGAARAVLHIRIDGLSETVLKLGESVGVDPNAVRREKERLDAWGFEAQSAA